MKEVEEGCPGYCPPESAIDDFLSYAKEIKLESGEVLCQAGTYDADVYIIKDGVIRYTDMNGGKERTLAFGLPGTLFMSMHSFVLHKPSYYQVEACCPSVLMRVSEEDYWKCVDGNKDVAIWMLHLAQGELCFREFVNSTVHNGDARERFIAMKANRPEIISKVPQKIIASYLGVTPEYLSRLKRSLL